MRIMLLGAPGSGKGTQAKVLAAHYSVAHIGVGDVLRKEVADGSTLGREVEAELARGDLVHDDVVFDVIWPLVMEAASAGGYVLDGFPRTLRQAEMAYDAALRDGVAIDAVVYFDADRTVLLDRMLARSAGRSDDNASVITHRLAVFEASTRPLVDFYDKRGILVRVDAQRAIDDVTNNIVTELDHRAQSR